MQNNMKPAVLLIIVLSMLLGLSIGQHYRQYRQIKALENSILHFSPVQVHINSNRCTPPAHLHQVEMAAKRAAIEAQRIEIEAIKASMRADREAQLKELRQQIERVQEMWKRGE